MKPQSNTIKWAGIAFLFTVLMSFVFLLPSVSAQGEVPSTPTPSETPSETPPLPAVTPEPLEIPELEQEFGVQRLMSLPSNAEEYFSIYQSSRLEPVLRGDFLLLILIGLYLGTIPALYVALRRLSPIYTALATLFSLIAVTGTFASESTFSLLHLGEQYVTATVVQRSQLIAAGQAIIASDMWNGTAAYMGGILLQGSGVMISLIMLRSKDFSKVTAYSGLIGNGLDLIQHILHPFAPSFSASISMVMGLFYFVWFPMLARDLFRLGYSQE